MDEVSCFKRMRRGAWFPLLSAGLLLFGCATVPKEVVELSYNMGEDLQAVHTSYKALIHERFEGFRQDRMDYFENDWKPKFIEAWIQKGRLIDVAGGRVVWSKAEKNFVPPVPGQERQGLLDSVQFWSQSAIKKLEEKRAALLSPLDADEKELTDSVDEAFNRLYRANATITAHLNTLRKVQEVQDEVLQELKAKDLRDQLNKALVGASDKAVQGLAEVQKADAALEKAKSVLPGKS